MKKRLRLDAELTAPWISQVPNIPAEALAFIVYHGGGNPVFEKVKDDHKAIRQLGSKKILRGMACQYGGNSNGI